MPIEVKPVRIFTREQPCTKVELYNCFKASKGFVRRPVVETRGEIGINAPKYLRKANYAILLNDEDVDYLVLTMGGQKWLIDGINRHLELHPGDAALLKYPVPATRTNGLRRTV